MTRMWTEEELTKEICNQLAPGLQQKVHLEDIRVDIASLDPRPENPYLDKYGVEIYDPVARKTITEPWARILKGVPSKAFIVRVFATSKEHAQEINEATRNVLLKHNRPPQFPTNI